MTFLCKKIFITLPIGERRDKRQFRLSTIESSETNHFWFLLLKPLKTLKARTSYRFSAKFPAQELNEQQVYSPRINKKFRCLVKKELGQGQESRIQKQRSRIIRDLRVLMDFRFSYVKRFPPKSLTEMHF